MEFSPEYLMRRLQLTEAQLLAIVRECEAGVPGSGTREHPCYQSPDVLPVEAKVRWGQRAAADATVVRWGRNPPERPLFSRDSIDGSDSHSAHRIVTVCVRRTLRTSMLQVSVKEE